VSIVSTDAQVIGQLTRSDLTEVGNGGKGIDYQMPAIE
jgi:hypothetical protein